jgi:hypothetical protein
MDEKSTLKLKDVISRQEPFSVGNIGGAGDLVFMMKDYGVDAFVYDTGVYIIREGFGQKKQLRRSPTFYDAVKKLHSQGYKPFPYFRPDFREQYEKKHLEAMQKSQEAIRFFPTYDKINVKDIKSSNEFYGKPLLQQPTLQQPIIYRQAPINRQPMIKTQPAQNLEEKYVNLFRAIDEANNEVAIGRNRSPIGGRRPAFLLDSSQFSSFANTMYEHVNKRNIALKNSINPYAIIQKEKTKAEKAKEKKAKEMELERVAKARKAGERNE